METILERAKARGQEMDAGLSEWLRTMETETCQWKQEVSQIEAVARNTCRNLGLGGRIELFGSAESGFGIPCSDVDLVLLADGPTLTPLEALKRIQAHLSIHGAFTNITSIFQPQVPLLKFTHLSGIEVDLVVNNHLGVRNTQLLKAYHDCCRQDSPGDALVRTVKEWARRCGLVGTTDGMINSYAWTLLAIYYLQVLEVLPNLQALAVEKGLPSWPVEGHETRFSTEAPPEDGAKGLVDKEITAGSLLWGFFKFYGSEFDWRTCAVSVRLARIAPHLVTKSELPLGERAFWYLEDPFDTSLNLAKGTTPVGRERIVSAMRGTCKQLQTGIPNWQAICPKGFDRPLKQLFLKSRLHVHGLRTQSQLVRMSLDISGAIWQLLNPYRPTQVFIQAEIAKPIEVYIRFRSWQTLRAAQSCTEAYMECCKQHLALYISLGYQLLDDLDRYTAYDAAGMSHPGSDLRAELQQTFQALPFGPRPATSLQSGNLPGRSQPNTPATTPCPTPTGPRTPLIALTAAASRTPLSANAVSFVPRTKKKVSECGGSTDVGSATASCPSETGVVQAAVAEISEEEDDYDINAQLCPLDLLTKLRPPSPSTEMLPTLPADNDESREAPVELPLPRFVVGAKIL